MRGLTDEQIGRLRAGDDRYPGAPLTVRLLADVCGGLNAALDAILDDALPLDLSEYANQIVVRQELTTRAQWRLARALERLQEAR